jgi:hypothetical protein
MRRISPFPVHTGRLATARLPGPGPLASRPQSCTYALCAAVIREGSPDHCIASPADRRAETDIFPTAPCCCKRNEPRRGWEGIARPCPVSVIPCPAPCTPSPPKAARHLICEIAPWGCPRSVGADSARSRHVEETSRLAIGQGAAGRSVGGTPRVSPLIFTFWRPKHILH